MQKWLGATLDLERGLVDHRQLGRFFARDGRFITHDGRFDFCGVNRNDVTAGLGRWENQVRRRLRFL